jgi:hypothetical protein
MNLSEPLDLDPMAGREGGGGGALAHWCCRNRWNSATMPVNSGGKYRLTWWWFRENRRGDKERRRRGMRGCQCRVSMGSGVGAGKWGTCGVVARMEVVVRGRWWQVGSTCHWGKRREGENGSGSVLFVLGPFPDLGRNGSTGPFLFLFCFLLFFFCFLKCFVTFVFDL